MDATQLLDKESDKPPSISTDRRSRWLVAVIANVKEENHSIFNEPADAGAEFDKLETIQSIQGAIEADGHQTIFLPADVNLPYALRDVHPDICFNIAEGYGADAREAQVPALLAMMGIPYTASCVLANAISLDKTLTKRIWRDVRLPIAPFQEFITGKEPLRGYLDFPLFVKPDREGTGMGVDQGAKVNNIEELRERVTWVIETYHQPALVESFLPGREFTVGVMGREDALLSSHKPELYAIDGFHRFPVLEIESYRSITPGIYSNAAKSKALDESGAPGYLCPANLEPGLAEKLQKLALRAHQAIGALDVSRVDIRLDEDGNPRLLEINTLPGLNPEVSDICIMAKAEGLPYCDLILEILYLAAGRYGLLAPQLVMQPLRSVRQSKILNRIPLNSLPQIAS
jgi:D-alanine-D-alanine ligase